MTDRKTPRYGHAPIPMRRVSAYGEITQQGDFFWDQRAGVLRITLALPSDLPSKGWIVNSLRVQIGESADGPIWGYDGEEDSPTLVPSIHCFGHWHGFVTKGTLVEA